MAKASGGGRGGRFRKHGRSGGTISEINVTPLVDVMLVLLVVFMVAAPMMTAGINVNLPKATAKPLPVDNKTPPTVSLDKDGQVYLDKTLTAVDALIDALVRSGASAADPEAKVVLKADKSVDYGKVMQVIGRLNAAGYHKISLLTEHGREP